MRKSEDDPFFLKLLFRKIFSNPEIPFYIFPKTESWLRKPLKKFYFPTLSVTLQVIIFHVRSLLMSRKTTKSVSQMNRSGLKSRFVKLRTTKKNSRANPSQAFYRSSSTSNLSPPMTSNSMNHLTDIDSTIASTSVDKRMIQSAMLCKQQLPVVDSCLDLGFFLHESKTQENIQFTRNGPKLRGRNLNWRWEIIIELFKITFWILKKIFVFVSMFFFCFSFSPTEWLRVNTVSMFMANRSLRFEGQAKIECQPGLDVKSSHWIMKFTAAT